MTIEKESSPEVVNELRPNSATLLARRLIRKESYVGAMTRPIHKRRWQHIVERVGEYSESQNHDMYVLQIGANDGRHSDPVHQFIKKYGWKGLLVEPVPQQFNRLKTTYAQDVGIKLVQAAVSDTNGRATMYVAKDAVSGNPLQGKDSLHLDIVKKHGWMVADFGEAVDSITVPTITLSTLLTSETVPQIDMFVTDTEGHDKVILDQLELDTMRPQFVMYEHCHLGKADQIELRNRFDAAGYATTTLRRDVFAEYQG